jgi:SAM-dependent methyltransferase
LDRLEAEYGALGSGIDVSRACLAEAAGENETSKLLACGDVVDLPFASNVFDVVVCLDVLEHIGGQERCLGELTRVLRPEGRLLLWTINRNQSFTWNWLLAKLGVDVFKRVSHDPLLLPKVGDTGASLTRAGLRLDRVELFNSFFTLLVDEAIMVVASVLERLGMFSERGRLSTSLGSAYLVLTDAISRASWRFLNRLDEPWRKRGFSNGFLILGSKLPSRLDRSAFSEFASR